MATWVQRLALVCILVLAAGCGPKVDGMGQRIPQEDAIRMAKAGSPLIEVTSLGSYTSPPTVHVVHGKDNEGRQVIVWVYTTVIRYAYADGLISAERAREIAKGAGFPVEAVRKASLQVFQGRLDGRENPVFWRLATQAGWIWVDAETESVLKRLDAE